MRDFCPLRATPSPPTAARVRAARAPAAPAENGGAGGTCPPPALLETAPTPTLWRRVAGGPRGQEKTSRWPAAPRTQRQARAAALPAGPHRWAAARPGTAPAPARWPPPSWCSRCRSRRRDPSSISAPHRSALSLPSSPPAHGRFAPHATPGARPHGTAEAARGPAFFSPREAARSPSPGLTRAGCAGATGPGGREEGAPARLRAPPLARPRAVPGSARRGARLRLGGYGEGTGKEAGAAAARGTSGLRHRPRRGFESPRLPDASP